MQLDPHRWSQDFAWHAPKGPFRRITDAQAKAYDEQGFFVLEDAIDPETLAALTAEIDAFEAQTNEFLKTREDGRLFIARADEITFTTHLVNRLERAREFCAGPVFQDLVHDLIGDDVRLYWDQAVYKRPGTEAPFPWHQDNGYTFVEPQQYLTCWVALTDATEDNGCPWVVPELHKGGTLAHGTSDLGFVCLDETPEAAVPAPVRAGGIVVFSSLTPHATGPNRTDAVRKSYIVQFAPDGAEVWLPGSDGAPNKIAADAPDRQFPVLVGGAAPA